MNTKVPLRKSGCQHCVYVIQQAITARNTLLEAKFIGATFAWHKSTQTEILALHQTSGLPSCMGGVSEIGAIYTPHGKPL